MLTRLSDRRPHESSWRLGGRVVCGHLLVDTHHESLLHSAYRFSLFGVTKAMMVSTTVIDTSDVPVRQRPTAKIRIGSKTYLVRAPKLDAMREVVSMLGKIDLAKELAAAEDITPEEEKQFDALVVEVGDSLKLEEAIITGCPILDPQTGEVMGLRGGYLRRCLSPEDWASVQAEWLDDDSDIDRDYLFGVARKLQDAWNAWLIESEAASELPPVTKPTRARRAPASPKR